MCPNLFFFAHLLYGVNEKSAVRMEPYENVKFVNDEV